MLLWVVRPLNKGHRKLNSARGGGEVCQQVRRVVKVSEREVRMVKASCEKEVYRLLISLKIASRTGTSQSRLLYSLYANSGARV